MGMLLFGKGLSKVTADNASTLFITMVMVQVMVPIVYKIILGGVTIKFLAGITLAVGAIVLLN